MGLAKLIIQITIIVITIAGLGGYAAINIFYYRKGKTMSQKAKKQLLLQNYLLLLLWLVWLLC